MRKNFRYGPFSFEQEGAQIRVGETPYTHWVLMYGNEEIRRAHVPGEFSQAKIVEAMASGIDEIKEKAARRAAEINVWIDLERCSDGEVIASFRAYNATDLGMKFSAGIPFEQEIVARMRGTTHIAHCDVGKFVSAAGRAKVLPWQLALLPDDVLSEDAEEWRPPTAFEIRHIVGEGSFTGISGAKAAQLVGISPANFRKYTADSGYKYRQNISFSAWHLLCRKLFG